MLYFILIVVGILISLPLFAQHYERHGNNFVSKVETKAKSKPIKTTFTFNNDTIYISQTGRCFVIKTSKKTGKEYRRYVGEELSKEVCSALKIEYVEDNKDKSSN